MRDFLIMTNPHGFGWAPSYLVGTVCDFAAPSDIERYQSAVGTKSAPHACKMLASLDGRLTPKGHYDRIGRTLTAALRGCDESQVTSSMRQRLLYGPHGAKAREAVALIAGSEICNLRPTEGGES